MAQRNADAALKARLAGHAGMQQRLGDLQVLLTLDEPVTRLECFDISHTQGEATVASCIVFDNTGPRKADYRQFNIKGTKGGDDYAAMQQALERRYKRLVAGEGQMPDILFIDGGKGQVAQAMEVMAMYDIASVRVVGIAKGTTRKAG